MGFDAANDLASRIQAEAIDASVIPALVLSLLGMSSFVFYKHQDPDKVRSYCIMCVRYFESLISAPRLEAATGEPAVGIRNLLDRVQELARWLDAHALPSQLRRHASWLAEAELRKRRLKPVASAWLPFLEDVAGAQPGEVV